ncbi:MAG: hypothetical protein M1404_00300 [Acidobacteria bacterium]|nr:hypothetical protein [Acidobacteriota bacterium]
MKILIYTFLGLILIAPRTYASTTGTDGKPTANQPVPLVRATEEFKFLTRQWGMRPNSPPSARRHLGPKMLWHGRVYEYFRNDVLDAIPHEVKQNGGTKSPLHRNQFGFSVSGPVLIPHLLTNPKKTFFMLSYEGVRETITSASLHTIPTLAQRNGDFSQTVDQAGNLLPIYDPATTTPNPAYNSSLPVSTSNLQYLRSTFPGNVMPTDRLSPEVQKILSYYPLPNTNVGPFFENNYFVNAPQQDDADGIIARVDENISSRHRLTFNTAISNGFLSATKFFPNIASPTAPDQHYSRWKGGISYVFTPNSRTVNSAAVSVTSNVVQSGDSSQSPFPVYALLGSYLSMGTAYPNSHNARNTIGISDTVSTQRGKHSLHLSFEADQYQVNTFMPVYPVGYFQFSTGLTSLPGIVDTGDPFASFLLGLPSYAENTVVNAPSYFRDSYQSIAGGDSYEISKTLTLSLNLNLSHRTPRVEKYNRQSTIDPSVVDPLSGLPGSLVFAGRNGVSRGLRPSNTDLDMSTGLAWNPGGNGKTEIRASFGRSHGMIPIYDGQWATQGFTAEQTFVSPNVQLSPALDFANGVPPLPTPLPDLNPSAADNTVADFMDMSGQEPVYRSASLSLERQTPFSMAVTVGTSYEDGNNILVGNGVTNPDAVNPSMMSYGDALYNQAFLLTLQPFPQFTSFNLYSLYPAGRYKLNTGYVQVEKRESFGLSFTASYQYTREFDNFSGPYANQDLVNLQNDWSATSWNAPQSVQLSYMYELPFGAGKPLFDLSGWGRPFVSGWSLSGTAYWNDGTPLALQAEYNNTGGVLPTVYPNIVPGVDPRVAHPGPSEWFNPAAFTQPPNFTMGNAPRTMSNLLGPGANSMDVSLDKRMPIGGNSLDFNVTAFNFLNHGNWNYPDTTIGPLSAPNVDAGKIIGSHGGRVIQLGLMFNF